MAKTPRERPSHRKHPEENLKTDKVHQSEKTAADNDEYEEIVVTNSEKDKWETLREKGVDLVHNLETNPNTKDFWEYLKTHKKEAILGACMLFGLLFSFLWLGGFMVGIGAGLYAPWGFKNIWRRGAELSD